MSIDSTHGLVRKAIAYPGLSTAETTLLDGLQVDAVSAAKGDTMHRDGLRRLDHLILETAVRLEGICLDTSRAFLFPLDQRELGAVSASVRFTSAAA